MSVCPLILGKVPPTLSDDAIQSALQSMGAVSVRVMDRGGRMAGTVFADFVTDAQADNALHWLRMHGLMGARVTAKRAASTRKSRVLAPTHPTFPAPHLLQPATPAPRPARLPTGPPPLLPRGQPPGRACQPVAAAQQPPPTQPSVGLPPSGTFPASPATAVGPHPDAGLVADIAAALASHPPLLAQVVSLLRGHGLPSPLPPGSAPPALPLPASAVEGRRDTALPRAGLGPGELEDAAAEAACAAEAAIPLDVLETQLAAVEQSSGRALAPAERLSVRRELIARWRGLHDSRRRYLLLAAREARRADAATGRAKRRRTVEGAAAGDGSGESDHRAASLRSHNAEPPPRSLSVATGNPPARQRTEEDGAPAPKRPPRHPVGRVASSAAARASALQDARHRTVLAESAGVVPASVAAAFPQQPTGRVDIVAKAVAEADDTRAARKAAIDRIRAARLSDDVLRRDHAPFRGHDPGEPGPTLYVKNIARPAREGHLLALVRPLFASWAEASANTDIVLHRRGRLRGQAFVTFALPELATSARELLHGFPLHGKPLCISFSKSTREEDGAKHEDPTQGTPTTPRPAPVTEQLCGKQRAGAERG